MQNVAAADSAARRTTSPLLGLPRKNNQRQAVCPRARPQLRPISVPAGQRIPEQRRRLSISAAKSSSASRVKGEQPARRITSSNGLVSLKQLSQTSLTARSAVAWSGHAGLARTDSTARRRTHSCRQSGVRPGPSVGILRRDSPGVASRTRRTLARLHGPIDSPRLGCLRGSSRER